VGRGDARGEGFGGGGGIDRLDPLRIKTAAFAISALCAGVAGALFAPLSASSRRRASLSRNRSFSCWW